MSEQVPEETPAGGQDEVPAVVVQAQAATASAAVPVPDPEDSED